jgi:hypothetical protein
MLNSKSCRRGYHNDSIDTELNHGVEVERRVGGLLLPLRSPAFPASVLVLALRAIPPPRLAAILPA